MAYGDLASVVDVQSYLNLFAGTDDAVFSRLITAASEFIHRFLNRSIPIADYEEIRNGTGGLTLALANFPVQSISALTIDTRPIPASVDGLQLGYLFDPTSITLRGWRFFRGMQNVVIRYTAGYPQIPADITQACVELVALRYRERTRIGVAQENIVGVQSDTWHIFDLLPATHLALQQFHSVVPISTFSRRLAPTQTDPTLVASAL